MNDVKAQGWVLNGERLKARSKRIPPLAPSKRELAFYEKYIKKAKKIGNTVLILGATPEIRDLAIKNGMQAYAVDISQDMLDKFTKLMQYKGNKNDIQIKCDWLKMKFSKGFFAICLADASFCNLPTRKQNENLFSLIYNLLDHKGYLIQRNWVAGTAKPRKLKDLVKKYRGKKISFSDFFGEIRLLTFMEQCHNKKNYGVPAESVYNQIKKAYAQGIFNKKEMSQLLPYFNPLTNCVYPEKEFIRLAKKTGFTPEKKYEDPKFRYTKWLKMYSFKKA